MILVGPLQARLSHDSISHPSQSAEKKEIQLELRKKAQEKKNIQAVVCWHSHDVW